MREPQPGVTGAVRQVTGPLTRRALLRSGALGVGGLSLASCGGSGATNTSTSGAPNQTSGTPRKGGTLTMARSADIVTFDPRLISDNMSLWGAWDTIYRGLVLANPTATGFVPELAESWSISSDSRRYTFKLRPDLRFSDGSPLKASDVVFSIGLLAFNHKSLQSFEYAPGMKLSAPDDRTVIVDYPKPALGQLAIIGINPVISEAWYKKNGSHKLANAPAGAGAGPWLFSSWTKGSKVVLKANPYYWDKPKPYLKEVVFNVVSDANSQVLQLESGAVDIATAPPINQVPSLKTKGGVAVQTEPLHGAYVILLNFARPQFRDAKVRQAMNYAVNKSAMINTLMYGDASPMNSVMPGGMEYHASTTAPWPYDLAKAKKLMSESSYPHGFAATLLIASGDPIQQGVGTIVKSQLAQIGITVAIQTLELNTQEAQVSAYKYDMCVEEYTADQVDPAIIVEFSSVGKTFVDSSWTKYYNPTINKLWNQSQVEASPSTRRSQFLQMQQDAWNDAEFLFLFYPKSITALRSGVHGFAVNPTGHYFLETVYKD